MDSFVWEEFVAEPTEEETVITCAIMDGDVEATLDAIWTSGIDVNRTMEEHSPLTLACQSGQLKVVVALLNAFQEEMDVSARTVNGATPLLCAANGGHTDICRFLVSRGADVNQRGDGSYPLHNAIYYKHEDTAVALLDLMADPQICDREGWHPLYYAATNGFTNLCRRLLDGGCHVDFGRFVGGDGGSFYPLHSAIYQGHLDTARLLLERGADVTLFDRTGRDPLCYAAGGGHVDLLVEMLDKGAEPNLRRKPDIIHENVQHPHAVEVFLDCGVDVDQLDCLGRTPLYVAAGFGHRETCELLIKRGASLKNTGAYCTGSMISSPLLKALNEGHCDVMELLLDEGADADCGRNPLLHAMSLKDVACCEVLLRRGVADPNVVDTDKTSALHVSTRHKFDAGTRLLLRAGADPNVVNAFGETPLRLAMDGFSWTSCKLLLLAGSRVGGDVTNRLWATVEGKEEEEEDVAEKERIDVDQNDARQRNSSLRWLHRFCFQPQPLQQLCRISLRRYLGRTLATKKADFRWRDLPASVKRFIYMEEE